jgi:hypothetical protein
MVLSIGAKTNEHFNKNKKRGRHKKFEIGYICTSRPCSQKSPSDYMLALPLMQCMYYSGSNQKASSLPCGKRCWPPTG